MPTGQDTIVLYNIDVDQVRVTAMKEHYSLEIKYFLARDERLFIFLVTNARDKQGKKLFVSSTLSYLIFTPSIPFGMN